MHILHIQLHEKERKKIEKNKQNSNLNKKNQKSKKRKLFLTAIKEIWARKEHAKLLGSIFCAKFKICNLNWILKSCLVIDIQSVRVDGTLNCLLLNLKEYKTREQIQRK